MLEVPSSDSSAKILHLYPLVKRDVTQLFKLIIALLHYARVLEIAHLLPLLNLIDLEPVSLVEEENAPETPEHEERHPVT